MLGPAFSLSPEQDGKLFDPSGFDFYTSHTQAYYSAWRRLGARTGASHWDDADRTKFLPAHLTDSERQTATKEIRALGEQLYTTIAGVPVITPVLAPALAQLHPNTAPARRSMC